MTQDITDFPFEIDREYLQLVKPQGYLRTWHRSLQNRADNFYTVGVELTFSEAGTEVAGQKVGGTETAEEDKLFQELNLKENIYVVNDLHSFNFDTMT